ncbi:unnamed protein product [Linum trigynum]|uniref:Uncharacterized protein n=1 Tax=Linum trigynum TaxID=586398 RepID=A0AAV2ECL5_9ROSI
MIRWRGTKTEVVKSNSEFMIPIARGLSKSVQLEDTSIPRLGKALGNVHIDLFFKIVMQECIIDIKLMQMSPATNNHCEHTEHSHELRDGGKSIMEVDTFNLCVTFGDQTSFEMLDRTISQELDFVNPLRRDGTFAEREID